MEFHGNNFWVLVMLFLNLFFAIELPECDCLEQKKLSADQTTHVVSSEGILNIFSQKIYCDRKNFIGLS